MQFIDRTSLQQGLQVLSETIGTDLMGLYNKAELLYPNRRWCTMLKILTSTQTCSLPPLLGQF